MKQTLLLLLSLSICLCSSGFKWKLSVQNDKVNGESVVLVPGIFTKVTFVLKNEGDQEFNTDDDQYTFEIVPEDDNIVLTGDVIALTPTSSLQASGYIGLKCGHTLSDSSFNLNFKVKAIKDKDGKDADGQAVLEFDTNVVTISNEKAKVDLEPVMSSISAESYTLMKVNEEPYNVLAIEVKAESDDSDFNPTDITIKKYDEKRGEYSPDNTVNHGILFDFKMKVEKTLADLKKKSFNLNLSLKGDDLQKCYELVKKTFKIDVLEQKIEELKDNIKQAIKYTLENISKKKDALSNIELRVNVPYAPVKISCEIRLNNSFSTDDEILANAKAEADVQYYNNIITSKGQVDLKLGQFNANAEYYTKCVFDTTALSEARKKLSVIIGNIVNGDFITQLKPARDPYRKPQCAKIEFSSVANLEVFRGLAQRYCNWVMTEGESLLVRLFSNAVCEVADHSILDVIIDKTAYICVAPSPLLKTYNTTSEEEGKKFDDSFDKFISGVKNASQIFNLDAVVKSVTKYVDEAPNPLLLSYKVDDGDLLVLLNKDIKFTITSTNTFPIECYYNSILTYDLSKKFGLLSNKEKFTLNPNVAKTITTKIPKNDFEEGRSYPLYLECYSLPGASVRYETTGVFNPFTYYYDKSKENTEPLPNTPTEVDCTLQENKYNPRCIKQKVESIVEQLKTDIPVFIQNIEAKVEEFKATAKAAQLKILTQLNETLKNTIDDAKSTLKTVVEKVIETAKYLANLDCSIYADGSSSEEDKTIKYGVYVQCRETKRNIMSKIVEFLQNKLQCSNVVQAITGGLSDDLEQNLKYVLLLLNEVTSSPDAFKNGTTEVLLDIENCLQEKYNEYWPKVEEYLNKTKNYVQESVDAVKKDVSKILMQTLSNLVEALHFDEIDGFINETEAKIKNTSMVVYTKAKKVYDEIKKYAKRLNEFGNGSYNISGGMSVDVLVNNGSLSSSNDAELFITNIENKGIKLLLHSNYLLRKDNSYAVQSLVFDSPLVSVKANGEYVNNTLNTFVDVTVYDKDGNEVVVANLDIQNYKPQVLFNKNLYKNLTRCLYYDEKNQILRSDGVTTDLNFEYEGEVYIKCTADHLTPFTLSNSEGETVPDVNPDDKKTDGNNEGTSAFTVVLISLLVLVIIVALVIAFIVIRKKTSSKPTDLSVMQIDNPILSN